MPVWHGDIGKKKTGGKIIFPRKKRKFEMGSEAVHTRIGKEKRKKTRTKGGNWKTRISSAEFANILDPISKKIQKVKILDVVENSANPQWIRRKIITKGAVIKTEIGNARVTSRPSQHGIVNAIMIEEKK